MGDGVFNIAKGFVNEYVQRVLSNDPATAKFEVHLWEGVAITDAAMRDLVTVAAIEATTLVEANFTNYAKVDITDTERDWRKPSIKAPITSRVTSTTLRGCRLATGTTTTSFG